MGQQPPQWRTPSHLKVTIDITPEQAEALLGLLQDDDEFRDRLVADPNGVLGEYGIHIEEGMPETIKLPSREALSSLVAHARDQELLHFRPEVSSVPHVFALLWWVIGAMPLVPRDA
jgi:hypothetical protein